MFDLDFFDEDYWDALYWASDGPSLPEPPSAGDGNYFDPDYFAPDYWSPDYFTYEEVVIPPGTFQVVAAKQFIQIYDGSDWVNLDDVIISESIQWTRGIQGNGPKDRVAGIGTVAFSLRNDAGNSVGLAGRYSPGHANHWAVFKRGAKIRIIYVYKDDPPYICWTGKLRNIEPDQGAYGPRRTRCRCESTIGDLITKVRELDPQIDQTEVQLLNAVLDVLPAIAQPTAREFDPPVETFPYALDDLGDGKNALTVIRDIVLSARGAYHEHGDGTHHYHNYILQSLETSAHDFEPYELSEFRRPSSLEKVFNRVRIQTHDKEVSAGATEVLFSHVGRLELDPGATVELFMSYQDPDNPGFRMGGRDFVDPPVAGVDYKFNSAPDGAGSDITADISLTAYFFASTCKLTITNTGGVTAYREILQGRGRSIIDKAPAWSEAFVPMDYGDIELEGGLDLRYQDSAQRAYEDAQYFAAQYSDLDHQIDIVGFVANRSEKLMRFALGMDTGQLIRVTEPQTATVLVAGYIQSISFTVHEGSVIFVRMMLAPRIESDVQQEDTVGVSDSLTQTSPVPETRIDIARIDLSEVG